MFKAKLTVGLLGIFMLGALQPAKAAPGELTASTQSGSTIDTAVPPVNCSIVQCTADNQRLIEGNRMFDESNFFAIEDAFGRARKFWIHIPRQYDERVLDRFLTPTIFAFHGAGQTSREMLVGKWEEYFDRGIAFVIPQGETNPCFDTELLGKRATSWMVPTYVPSATPDDPNCIPAERTAYAYINGQYTSGPVHFWDTTMPETFADVEFVEALLDLLAERFPRLGLGKKYATGFSNGGALTHALLCYRSSLFEGYSVTGWSLLGHLQRGDLSIDLLGASTDPDSLAATCGRTRYDGGHATGISNPELWGYGLRRFVSGAAIGIRYEREAKPVIQFAGENDPFTRLADVDESSDDIRTRNNLDSFHSYISPYLDTEPSDGAITESRNYTVSADISQPHAAYRELRAMRYGLIRYGQPDPAGHGMADAEECDRVGTCDYSYTTETLKFFLDYAGFPGDPFTIPPKPTPFPLK